MKVSDYIIKGEANVAAIEELIAIAEGNKNKYTEQIEELEAENRVLKISFAKEVKTTEYGYVYIPAGIKYYTKKDFVKLTNKKVKSTVIKALKSNLDDSNALIKTLTKNKLVRILFKKQIKSYGIYNIYNNI